MTGEEMKPALLNRERVRFKGCEYRLNGILYRRTESRKIKVSAELMDEKSRCLVYAPAREIERILPYDQEAITEAEREAPAPSGPSLRDNPAPEYGSVGNEVEAGRPDAGEKPG